MGRLENKTAMVTGGRQGIGRAIVDVFIAKGAKVLTCGRGSRPENLPRHVLWQTTDMSDQADIGVLKNVVENEFESLSVLVNNAGVQIEKTVLDLAFGATVILRAAKLSRRIHGLR